MIDSGYKRDMSSPAICPSCSKRYPKIELIAGHNGYGYGCTSCRTVLGTSNIHATAKLEILEE